MSYNKTQLNPIAAVDRIISHRDQWAHLHRFYFVIKLFRAQDKPKILDFGCGSGEMFELFYRNRYNPTKYLGLDIRTSAIAKNKEKFASQIKSRDLDFKVADLCSAEQVNAAVPIEDWDVITCFEVIEHVGKDNTEKLLKNIKAQCSKDTMVLISTPNYDPKVGAAGNHVIDGVVGEWDHDELNALLEKHFTIEKEFGTFASIKDYKDTLTPAQNEVYDLVSQYYDVSMLSVFFAPMIDPKLARNTIRVLKLKGE